MADVGLEMLQAVMQRTLEESAATRRDIGIMRDDMRVLTAIVMRQDNTMAALLTELRAMHSQHGRLANRVEELEATRPAVQERLMDQPAVTYSTQYQRWAVWVLAGMTVDDVLQQCRDVDAVFSEGGPDEAPAYVVVMRPEVGPELYTEAALRRTRRLAPARVSDISAPDDTTLKRCEFCGFMRMCPCLVRQVCPNLDMP